MADQIRSTLSDFDPRMRGGFAGFNEVIHGYQVKDGI